MMQKEIQLIDKSDVICNLKSVLNHMNDILDYSGIMFGLYYRKEYMDIDTTVDYSDLDIICNFVYKRSLNDLDFYYMSAPFLDSDYVYVSDSKYKNSSIDDIQWELRSHLIVDDSDPDILLKLNPTWYADDFDRNKYNYDYEGDVCYAT